MNAKNLALAKKLLEKNSDEEGGGSILIIILLCCFVIVIAGVVLYFGNFLCSFYSFLGYSCPAASPATDQASSQAPANQTPTPSYVPSSPSVSPPAQMSGTCQGTWSGDSPTCYSDWQNGTVTLCGESGNHRQTFFPFNPSAPECVNAPTKRIGSACQAPACGNKEPPVSGVCPPHVFLYDDSLDHTDFIPNNISTDPSTAGAMCRWTSRAGGTGLYRPTSITCQTGYSPSPLSTVCNAPGITGECDACGGVPPPPPPVSGQPPPPPSTVQPTSGVCQQYYRSGPQAQFFPNISSLGGARCGASRWSFYDPTSIDCPAGYTPSSHKMKCILSSLAQTPDLCAGGQTDGNGAVVAGGPPLGCVWSNYVGANGQLIKGQEMPNGCTSPTSCS